MSRIGKKPIVIPDGVKFNLEDNNCVVIKGPKGELKRQFSCVLKIIYSDDKVVVERPDDLKKSRELHGLTRTLINNMIIGVTKGYTKVLEINGVGYRAQKSGNKLNLTLGYSHPVVMIDPEGLSTSVDQNKIIVTGIDKEKVGQYAADIRDKRGPEPYNGKGIKYIDEHIRRKVGKTGKK